MCYQKISRKVFTFIYYLLASDRVRVLESGLQIVLAHRVEEFLAFAANLFEISVCSLG